MMKPAYYIQVFMHNQRQRITTLVFGILRIVEIWHQFGS